MPPTSTFQCHRLLPFNATDFYLSKPPTSTFQRHRLLPFNTTDFYLSMPPTSTFQHHRLLPFNATDFYPSTPPTSTLQHHRLLPFNTTDFYPSTPPTSTLQHHRRLPFNTTDFYLSTPPTSTFQHHRLLPFNANDFYLSIPLTLPFNANDFYLLTPTTSTFQRHQLLPYSNTDFYPSTSPTSTFQCHQLLPYSNTDLHLSVCGQAGSKGTNIGKHMTLVEVTTTGEIRKVFCGLGMVAKWIHEAVERGFFRRLVFCFSEESTTTPPKFSPRSPTIQITPNVFSDVKVLDSGVLGFPISHSASIELPLGLPQTAASTTSLNGSTRSQSSMLPAQRRSGIRENTRAKDTIISLTRPPQSKYYVAGGSFSVLQ
ncbi:hypothetical protein NFI96_009382 [Prochilodus magdalenae]|nr:hypothetical protein NFI96_009382 [Prochilodus magdalenae]